MEEDLLMVDMPTTQILVVEDDAFFRQQICALLKQHIPNVGICEAADGESAIRELHVKYDLMILDLGLPGVHGQGVAMANELNKSNIPILIVTGDRAPDIQYIGDINHMGTLLKPIDEAEFIKAVKTILSGKEYV